MLFQVSREQTRNAKGLRKEGRKKLLQLQQSPDDKYIQILNNKEAPTRREREASAIATSTPCVPYVVCVDIKRCIMHDDDAGPWEYSTRH